MGIAAYLRCLFPTRTVAFLCRSSSFGVSVLGVRYARILYDPNEGVQCVVRGVLNGGYI